MRKDEFSVKNLVNTFDVTPPAWLQRLPLWAWAMTLLGIPMLIRIANLMYHLPLPYGTLIGPADPDPWLRLSLVRDWLSGSSWYDHEVVRSNAPWGGISTPWTRPLDIVIALLVKLQVGAAPLYIKLERAALLLPWIWMMLLLAGLFRAMDRLKAAPASLFITVAMVGTMPVIWNYFGTGNADHHAPLCVLWVWTLTELLVPPPAKPRLWLSGLLLALMLWMSPEALALIGVLYLFHGLAWLAGHPATDRLPMFASWVAFGATAALMIEVPPAHWSTPVYDSISVVYIFILTLAALLAWALLLSSKKLLTLHARVLAALAAIGLAGMALWYVFPLAFKGPLAEANPFITAHFLKRITEAQPLFTERPFYVVAMLIQPVAAIMFCCKQLMRRETLYAPYQTWLLLFLVMTTSTLYLAEHRWYYYFYPVVVVTLAPYLAALFTPSHPAVAKKWPANELNKRSEAGQLKQRGPIFFAVFLLPLLLLLTMEDRSTANSRKIDACQLEARKLIYGAKLNDLGGGKPLNLLAPTDLGGEILFWTPHAIVASNYHREGKGIEYVWTTENITDTAQLRHALAERKISAILYCPQAETKKDSVLGRIQKGEMQPPAWLKKVPFASELAPDEQPLVMLVR